MTPEENIYHWQVYPVYQQCLYRTTESTGACFIRTDQLDGETDWKLRLAVPATQRLQADEDLLRVQVQPQRLVRAGGGLVVDNALCLDFPCHLSSVML